MGKKFTMRYKNKLCDIIKSTILLRSTMTIVAGRVTTKFQRRINCKKQGVNRKLNHNIIVIAAHVQYVAIKWVNGVPIHSLTVITSHHITSQINNHQYSASLEIPIPIDPHNTFLSISIQDGLKSHNKYR